MWFVIHFFSDRLLDDLFRMHPSLGLWSPALLVLPLVHRTVVCSSPRVLRCRNTYRFSRARLGPGIILTGKSHSCNSGSSARSAASGYHRVITSPSPIGYTIVSGRAYTSDPALVFLTGYGLRTTRATLEALTGPVQRLPPRCPSCPRVSRSLTPFNEVIRKDGVRVPVSSLDAPLVHDGHIIGYLRGAQYR